MLYLFSTEYASSAAGGGDTSNTDVDTFYPFFQDVHVMIFVRCGGKAAARRRR